MVWNTALLYAFVLFIAAADVLIAGTLCVVVYQIIKKLNQRFSWTFNEMEESFPSLFRQLAILAMGVWWMTDMFCKYSPIHILQSSAGFAILFPF